MRTDNSEMNNDLKEQKALDESRVRLKAKLRHGWWTSWASLLLGTLSNFLAAAGVFELKELTAFQLTILASVFLSVAAAAYVIRYVLKAGEATRETCRKVVDVYLTQMDHTDLNPVPR